MDLQGSSLSLAWALPFIVLIMAMALLPLFATRLWERLQPLVVLVLVATVVAAMAATFGASRASLFVLRSVFEDYVPFVLLLTALFVTAGGVVIRGNLRGTPRTNTALLAIGMLLANVVGTTGASVVLIRPLLRANDDRRHNAHVVVFFIFLVSNIGGSLTPLGDPPLFLGYLHGVDFFWPTLHLLPLTASTAGLVLLVFCAIDSYLYRKEGTLSYDPTPPSPLRLAGMLNMVLVAAIVATVILTGTIPLGSVEFGGLDLRLANLLRDAILLTVTLASVHWTPAQLRRENDFAWGPLREVALLFAGIFITLIPVIAMLRAGLDGPFAPLISVVVREDGGLADTALFWVTGALSSFLDNAPTYLVFFELAGGDAHHLMAAGASSLVAISAGAVFMGANSYIGNAPNLMVHAIARRRGVQMPGFFGYLAWSTVILLPIFLVVSTFLLDASKQLAK